MSFPLYAGARRGGVEDGEPDVRVFLKPDSEGEPLPVRLDLRNHSPNGFEWGYQGSGPSQLALAILARELGDEMALEYYQRFKWETVARWGRGFWSIDSHQIRSVVAKLQAQDYIEEAVRSSPPPLEDEQLGLDGGV
jgi:uncharacterized protein (DUF2249 family)